MTIDIEETAGALELATEALKEFNEAIAGADALDLMSEETTFSEFGILSKYLFGSEGAKEFMSNLLSDF